MSTNYQYGSLREKIAAEKTERQARYAAYRDIIVRAEQAAREAYKAAAPEPMTVQDDRTGQTWHVSEGVCGFAWVTVFPGTSSFARWLVKAEVGRKAYRGGIQIWMRGGQSYERKSAAANAYADTLRAAPELAGLRIHAGGRLD